MQKAAAPDLRRRALVSLLRFAVVLAVMIFLPAWSLTYWQGWLFWLNFIACMIVMTLYFLTHDPALVGRRMSAGPTAEKEASQKRIQLFASIIVCALFVVPALDRRFGWSTVPAWVVILGNVLVIAGFWMMFVVFRENSFASAIIEVDAEQRVISTGPYALVRHPMYSGALVMFTGVPLALGSWWGLLLIIPLLAILIVRLLDEERYLLKNLPGYEDYSRNVPHRLMPGVW